MWSPFPKTALLSFWIDCCRTATRRLSVLKGGTATTYGTDRPSHRRGFALCGLGVAGAFWNSTGTRQHEQRRRNTLRAQALRTWRKEVALKDVVALACATFPPPIWLSAPIILAVLCSARKTIHFLSQMLVVNRPTSLYIALMTCNERMVQRMRWARGWEITRRFSRSSHKGRRIEATILVSEFFAPASIACGRNNRTSKNLKLAVALKAAPGKASARLVAKIFCHVAPVGWNQRDD
jgi:hypothetical protein